MRAGTSRHGGDLHCLLVMASTSRFADVLMPRITIQFDLIHFIFLLGGLLHLSLKQNCGSRDLYISWKAICGIACYYLLFFVFTYLIKKHWCRVFHLSAE